MPLCVDKMTLPFDPRQYNPMKAKQTDRVHELHISHH